MFACNRITLASPLVERFWCQTIPVEPTSFLYYQKSRLFRLSNHFRFSFGAPPLEILLSFGGDAQIRQKMGDIFSFQGSAFGLRLAFRLFPSRATSIYYINTTQSVKGWSKYFCRLAQTASKYGFEDSQGFLFWRWRLMMRKILAKWCDG